MSSAVVSSRQRRSQSTGTPPLSEAPANDLRRSGSAWRSRRRMLRIQFGRTLHAVFRCGRRFWQRRGVRTASSTEDRPPKTRRRRALLALFRTFPRLSAAVVGCLLAGVMLFLARGNPSEKTTEKLSETPAGFDAVQVFDAPPPQNGSAASDAQQTEAKDAETMSAGSAVDTEHRKSGSSGDGDGVGPRFSRDGGIPRSQSSNSTKAAVPSRPRAVWLTGEIEEAPRETSRGTSTLRIGHRREPAGQHFGGR